MKKLLMLFMLFPIASLCRAQYPALLIADSLKKNAHVITRLNELVYELKSPGKAVEHEHHIYTILDEEGNHRGRYSSYYDKFTSINYISGKLYDAYGKELKHIKTKDMADESGSDQETLMTDTRYKRYDFGYRSYPYTVDFEEEDEINGILELHDWFPQGQPEASVELDRYTIITPKDYVLRYKAFNYNSEPTISEKDDKKIYTWEIKNLTAKKPEEAAPEWRELFPYVIVSPSDFEAEGYKGNMATWNSYGKFFYDLLEGSDVLPDEVKNMVHQLTDGLKNPKDKIYALYDFLQKNTRYISIQLGIGGFQPFDAKFVGTKKYGDCKALSNYFVALLKEAGIKGNSVIIRSGSDAAPIIEEFPSDQFDHVIACVPMEKDTIWLECTSQTQSPGFMGTFTGNRKALLVDESGGYLVSTPTYSAQDNIMDRKVEALVDAEGNLDAEINTNYSGIREEFPDYLINEATKEQRTKYLNSILNLPTYQVDKNDYSEIKGTIPVATEILHISSKSYASVSGKRLFIVPNLFNKNEERFKSDSARQYPITFKYAYKDIDSIHLQIPDGYAPEAVPKNLNLQNKFGKYSISYKIDGKNILCIRFFEKNSGRYPPSEYNNLVKFYDDMYKADRSKIVFVKKDS